MKKLFAMLLILVMMFTLTACGGDTGNTGNTGNTGGDTVSQEDTNKVDSITTANWQSVVKEKFSVDVTLPSGWAIKNAQVMSGGKGVKLTFTPDTATDLAAFAKTVYDACDAASDKMADMTSGNTEYKSFEEADTSKGLKLRYYITADDFVKVNLYQNRNVIEMTLSR
ncbi:MAG: hypothetical protein IJY28_03115 [Clostridia bacterium]|nr:hypothetical protein [Clostridia bacterium]